MSRFARYWDMIGNSGRFEQTLPLLLDDAPFARFWKLSEWIYTQAQQTHKIALPRLFVLVHEGGQAVLEIDRVVLEAALLEDYSHTGQKGAVPFLQEHRRNMPPSRNLNANRRQLRHV